MSGTASFIFPLDLGPSQGAYFIGYELSLVLNGWFLAQVWRYFHLCRDDSVTTRLVVAFLAVIETIISIITLVAFYGTFVASYGDLGALLDLPISLCVLNFLTPVTIGIVQTFFVYRLYRLMDGRTLDVIVICLALVLELASVALGIVFTSYATEHRSKGALSLVHRWKVYGTAMSGLSALSDVFITWALCRRLSSWRNGLPSTEHTISRMSSFLLNRGILLLLLQAAAVVAFVSPSNMQVYLFFPTVLAKFYANSLVSFLVSFEPHRIKSRVATASLGTSQVRTDGHPRSIHLEVLQTTDAFTDPQTQSADSIMSSAKLKSV